jgi:DNA-directed RNA polymerase subunit RPC12/RpoP
VVLRQAILTQYDLLPSDRHELHACAGCGKPYLLTSVWLPLSDDGTIACPRCGAEAISWDGARGYLVYWQRESERTRPTASTKGMG